MTTQKTEVGKTNAREKFAYSKENPDVSIK